MKFLIAVVSFVPTFNLNSVLFMKLKVLRDVVNDNYFAQIFVNYRKVLDVDALNLSAWLTVESFWEKGFIGV